MRVPFAAAAFDSLTTLLIIFLGTAFTRLSLVASVGGLLEL